MGYDTSYSLSMKDGSYDLVEQFVEENEYAKYALCSNGDCRESCKWYEHEKDMRKFSKKHPKAIFILSGEGEESGDIWKKYYKNGKMQKCKAVITFEEFNSKKLK